MSRTWISRAAIVAFGTAIALSIAAPAWSAATTAGPSRHGDPSGSNGAVSIDALDTAPDTNNEPHVTCGFEVQFANFDRDERVNVVLAAQPPTGSGTELLRRDGVLASSDAAGGGRPDPDETLRLSIGDLQLAGITRHPQQGYHIKLTVERIGAHGAGKHKVFWLEPCAPPAPPAGEATAAAGANDIGAAVPTDTASTTKADSATPAAAATTGTSSSTTGGRTSLAVTGTAVNGLVILGLGLMAVGVTLAAIRRRRLTFTA